MNSDDTRKPTLDDVLDEIATSDTAPDNRELRAWMSKYPEYSRAIVEFVTDWVATDAMRGRQAITPEDVDLVVNRTMSRVQATLDAERPSTIQDLLQDAEAAGHDPHSLQRVLGIDDTLLSCLAARLIEPATVPLRLVQGLVRALSRPIDLVRDYLRMPPQAVGALRSRKRPELQRQDFATLVKCSLLPEAEKERWIREARDPVLQE